MFSETVGQPYIIIRNPSEKPRTSNPCFDVLQCFYSRMSCLELVTAPALVRIALSPNV
jgi:hypothetical protein